MTSVYEGYKNKLKNKYFGLLKEREKGGEWEKFLDTILVELTGFEEDSKTINYYILYHKTASLRLLRYEYFRKTIFECMNIISNLKEIE